MAKTRKPRKPQPKRRRPKYNLTLNPIGVNTLKRHGKARASPETNLSRLVDDAITEYNARRDSNGAA